jgi:cytochrome P450
VVDSNCKKIREYILRYVKARKSGERKAQLEDGVDLLSLFFENKDIFTDEFIVDELLDFFTAAAVTTQAAS